MDCYFSASGHGIGKTALIAWVIPRIARSARAYPDFAFSRLLKAPRYQGSRLTRSKHMIETSAPKEPHGHPVLRPSATAASNAVYSRPRHKSPRFAAYSLKDNPANALFSGYSILPSA